MWFSMRKDVHAVLMRNMQCTIVWIYPNTVTKFREVPLLAPPGEKPEIKKPSREKNLRKNPNKTCCEKNVLVEV